jgi:uncharacterized protein
MSAIIFHHNDADGRCAAAIMAIYCRNHGYECEFIEMDYKDRVPIEHIKLLDFVAIVDFSFKPEIVAEIRKIATHVVWCDHHITAKDYGYDDVDGFRDFSEKGLSGCECTWRYCFPKVPIPEFASLLGDYDSWRLFQQPKCFQFYEGLKLQDTSPDGGLWNELIEMPCHQEKIIDSGKYAIRYRDNYCSEIRTAFGYKTEIAGQKALALNAYRFGSGQFGEQFHQYPLCIAYIHDGKQFTVSLYSETIDVSQIAKQFGGGGHKGASGFICDKLPFERKPQ